MKLKKGDRVKIIKGRMKGEVGYVTSKCNTLTDWYIISVKGYAFPHPEHELEKLEE